MAFELYEHQKELLTKLNEKLDQGKKSIMVVSPAGSGKSVMIAEVVRQALEKGEQVLFMVHRKELLEQIEATLSQNGVDITQMTIMSVLKIKNRLETLAKPDLIITDETHHAKAESYLEIYHYYSDVAKIGFTATPVRLNGEGFEDVYEEMIEGRNVQWLIDNHYLAPYRYYSLPVLDRKKLKQCYGEYTNRSINEALSGTTIFGKVVDTYLEKAKGEQAILYAHNVEYSKRYAQMFCESGIQAIHVDSKTPRVEREKIMKGFKEKQYRVICNVDLISEGFDVPDCTTIILLRPTQSLTVYVQQSMRGMRYKPRKTSIIIDHVGNYLKHGLPNTDRLWSLKGVEKETIDEELNCCFVCKGVFPKWKVRETETHRIKSCPLCQHEIVLEKEVSVTNKEMNHLMDSELQEITQIDEQYVKLKEVAKLDQRKFKDSVLILANIFVTRNTVADFEGRKRPYNYPIHFAIRQFAYYNRLKWIDEKELYSELEAIEELFGEEYQVETVKMMKYFFYVKYSSKKNKK